MHIPAELESGVPRPDDDQAQPQIDMRRGPRLQRPVIARHPPLAIAQCGEPQDQQRSDGAERIAVRSEEHTSELQSLMRISYAVFCLNKKKKTNHPQQKIRS